MFIIPIKGNEQLIVESTYDSGRHIGICVGVREECTYGNSRSLDRVLSKEQIRGLEAVVAATVIKYLEEVK